LDEHVILSFGLANDVELPDAKGEATGDALEGPAYKRGSFAYESFELPQIFNDANFFFADALQTKTTGPFTHITALVAVGWDT
jgi:hypothetical protein